MIVIPRKKKHVVVNKPRSKDSLAVAKQYKFKNVLGVTTSMNVEQAPDVELEKDPEKDYDVFFMPSKESAFSQPKSQSSA